MKKTLIIIMCLFQASCAGFIGSMDTPYGFITFNEKNIEIAPKAISYNEKEINPTK